MARAGHSPAESSKIRCDHLLSRYIDHVYLHYIRRYVDTRNIIDISMPGFAKYHLFFNLVSTRFCVYLYDMTVFRMCLPRPYNIILPCPGCAATTSRSSGRSSASGRTRTPTTWRRGCGGWSSPGRGTARSASPSRAAASTTCPYSCPGSPATRRKQGAHVQETI